MTCLARKGPKGWLQVRQDDHRASRPGPWYFCVSKVADATGAILKRRRQDVVCTTCGVVDDWGTKVTAAVPPGTWKIETSPGNFQVGYAYSVPVAPEVHEALWAAIIAKIGGDSVGDAPRVMRVPGSLNDKHTPAFAAVLHEWHPERSWTPQGLADDFGVTIGEVTPTHRPRAALSAAELEALGPVEDPVVDWLLEQGLVRGRPSGNGYLPIVCPWAEEHGDPRDEAGYRPLGETGARHFKCHHDHGGDPPTTDQFLAFVEDQGGPVVEDQDLGLAAAITLLRSRLPQPKDRIEDRINRARKAGLPDVVLTGGGFPAATQLATIPNIRYVLGMMQLGLTWNVMTDAMEWPELEGDVYRAVLDECARVGIKSRADVDECLTTIAQERRYHPAEDWIRSRPWDGTPRLETLAATVHVAECSQVAWPLYLRRWLLQTVEAVCGWRKPRPTSKPQVLVLAGPQGCGKTQWLVRLMPAEFTLEGVSVNLGHNEKDAMMRALSRPIVELGELETTFKRSDVGELKNFISRAEDTYRMPYARNIISRPRRTSLCASVNSAQFLQDETGSRRFLPVQVETIDWDHEIDRQQLWAEVWELWNAGESWYLTAKENDLRVDLEDGFTLNTHVEDGLNAHLLGSAMPFEQWTPLTLTEIGEALGIRMANAAERARGAAWLDKHVHDRLLNFRGLRKLWFAPIPTELLKANQIPRRQLQDLETVEPNNRQRVAGQLKRVRGQLRRHFTPAEQPAAPEKVVPIRRFEKPAEGEE